MTGTGNLIKEAYDHIATNSTAKVFSTQEELKALLTERAHQTLYACYLLSCEHFGTAKKNELVRAFPGSDLSWEQKVLQEPYGRFVYLAHHSEKSLEKLVTIFPEVKGETNQLKIKQGKIGSANLSVKTIRKDSKQAYAGILPKSARSKNSVLIQPLVTVSHELEISKAGNSSTPHTAIIYYSAIQYIKPAFFKPTLDVAFAPTRVWSRESASLLSIKEQEMQINSFLAHLLIADAMQNTYDGAAFTNQD